MMTGKNEYDIQLPFGPPPVLPDVQKQLREYLLCPDRLPIHNFEQAQKYWPREPNPRALFHCEMAPLGTTLKVDRDPTTGKLLKFREVLLDNMGFTAKNSMSLQRAPGPPEQAVRGSNTNYPFWPGGIPELLSTDATDDQDSEVDFINNLLTVPPGFKNGIKFKADGKTPFRGDEEFPEIAAEPPAPKVIPQEEEVTVVNLMSIVKQEEDLLGLWNEESKPDEKNDKEKIVIENLDAEVENEVSEVIPKEDIIPVLKISETPTQKGPAKARWAEELDVSKPVEDFEKKIPIMAKTWKFELDTFQKKAIMKLEEHANVFVAAHTSAGKTVVAEYAIALSQKHMTKSIYTSPIKALSNQKYRDFKETFGDVGLITGDFQINQTAQCLIMTTEILRSMLYCGSEVVRDLEYVIFDEVHYINDSERGHVWEEVLILLPDHVSIVMLSATVPNTMQFADWVGGTKKKKVYVISTLKRPVPLRHFLYTGSGGKSKDERFLIIGEDGKRFRLEGYSEACKAKQARQSNQKATFGPKQGRQLLTPKQETTMWVGFIDHLKREDKLPVVAFTLSRNRCDQNSANLNSVDLTTAKEKRYVLVFFHRCIQNLKPADRLLPQVVKLEDLLKRGIGVHHSGILPILKEIVEMLFQKGLVKLLFATETFAMGVNMPARTVVFDTIRKFDGHGMRPLQPAEYIQMAGRAGRRGLDKTGTVIIMCKGDVPERIVLESMMLGKPTILESKFRLTYSMILNLFRVEKISIEGMMSHSFKEFEHKISQKKYEKELKVVEETIRNSFSESQKQAPHWQPLSDFYDLAEEYFSKWAYVRGDILSHPKYQKDMVPGRVMLISHKAHVNKLGILLAVDSNKKEKVYHILVLCNSENSKMGEFSDEIQLSVVSSENEKPKQEEEHDPLWYKMLGIASKKKIFIPDGVGGHAMLTVTACDIVDIVKHTIKLEDPSLVLSDWEKRQIPRFRNNPPGQACSLAIKKLTEFTQNVASGSTKLEFVSPTKDINVRKPEIIEHLCRLDVLGKKIADCSSINIAHFEQQFEAVFRHRQLERKRNKLKHMQSYESLSLFPEFKSRVQVLKKLRLIDSNNTLELKGRVACEMGNHELMITEMLFENILQDKQPEEIAALLSCLVFQQRVDQEPEVTESLEQGKKKIKEISNNITKIEKSCDVNQEDTIEEIEKLNFGLMEVVYEWARGKPFSEIMNLTNIQEGIIVRCIQQLNETLRDVKNAALLIGEPVLKQKMHEASDAIKRDIVFAASLYTSEENRQIRQSIDDESLLPDGDE